LPDEEGGKESQGLLISETVVPGFEFCDHDFLSLQDSRGSWARSRQRFELAAEPIRQGIMARGVQSWYGGAEDLGEDLELFLSCKGSFSAFIISHLVLFFEPRG